MLQFFFDKGENSFQMGENVNIFYGHVIVTAIYAKFWFRRFRSGNFDMRDASHPEIPIVGNIDNSLKSSHRNFSTVSFAQ